MYKSPEYLKKGDKVGIVAPARFVSEDKIVFCENVLADWGYTPVRSKNLLGKHNQFSGTEKSRLADLQEMMDHQEIKAIICAGGGYGAIHLVLHLNFAKIRQYPKWLIGFSDITVLHAAFQVKGDLSSIHGTMPVKFDKKRKTKKSIESLGMALTGELKEYEIPSVKGNIIGKAEGILVGGNLSILYSLLGTPYDMDYSGKILFIEEVDEYLYHIERMIYSFKLTGKLSEIKGLVVGYFSNIHDNKVQFGKNVKDIIIDAVREYQIPVIFDFPTGHNDTNMALYLGRKVLIDSGKKTGKINFI